MKKNYSIKKENDRKKLFAVMLVLLLLMGVTACGSSNEQTAGEQETTGQTEENQSVDEELSMEEEDTGNDNVTDSAGESAVEEPEAGMESESLEDTAAGAETDSMEAGAESNILVAYFSRVGNMNFDESIDAVTSASINMDGSNVSGNAQLLAEMAQAVTGGDLFFIETVGKYPAEYRGTTDQAKTEQDNDARPELSSHVENMDKYDTVILIFPNWWGTLPQPVFTFLEEYDFSGKTILPLCTHEGSGLGRSEGDIEAVCPDAQLLEGLSVRGSSANSAQAEVEEWISRSGVLE